MAKNGGGYVKNIMNVWRLIGGVSVNAPLAFGDTVLPEIFLPA
jgi:hypothetical protein